MARTTCICFSSLGDGALPPPLSHAADEQQSRSATTCEGSVLTIGFALLIDIRGERPCLSCASMLLLIRMAACAQPPVQACAVGPRKAGLITLNQHRCTSSCILT